MAYWLSIEMEVGVTGLWTGFILGQFVLFFVYAFLLMHVDWQEIFRDIRV